MDLVKMEGNFTGQMKHKSMYGILLLALAFIFCSPAARAQIDTGAITGTLRDDQGAVLSNASVAIRNLATGVTSTTKTNTDGTYQVLALIPGTYTVEATAPGFGAARNPSVEIHVQTRAQIDFTLHVGTVQSQVEVQESAVQLQTQSADVGTVIGANQINDLPLNSRRYADLALLSPGVFKNPSVANRAPDRTTSRSTAWTITRDPPTCRKAPSRMCSPRLTQFRSSVFRHAPTRQSSALRLARWSTLP
jgi:hypothetical protein